jgi:polyribonucleotide nucleotidyltransferase
MFQQYTKRFNWGGKDITLETGKIARQADGCILASCGNTVVMATVVANKEARDDVDFLPLTVHYQEKAVAFGRIPGGFMKRESKPSEREVLVSRLIDRPIRPLFPDGFYHETQVICTLLSYEEGGDPDILALIATSAAIRCAGLPFEDTLAACRVGYASETGEYILNCDLPTDPNGKPTLDLVVAGTKKGVLMVESEANILSEAVMLGAVNFGHQAIVTAIDAIDELAEQVGKEQWQFTATHYNPFTDQEVAQLKQDLKQAYTIKEKQDRSQAVADAKSKAINALTAKQGTEQQGDEVDPIKLKSFIKAIEKDIVRRSIVETKSRIDGRSSVDVRSIVAEVDVLPSIVHGSALFTRGETQALATITLAGPEEGQIQTIFGEDYREKFMLHYNFPPYCVGEAGRMGPPGRREIGHGKLAWRALHPTMPNPEDFSYTIRAISEITESNGSSSMATVCATSLALMAAGVPVSKPVAGIAMGLIKEEDDVVVLSDILGDEDYLGDMDFKVAGTDEGITSLQMDIKITGITPQIMETALAQAKQGRIHILSEMAKALASSREQVSSNAPSLETITIDPSKIGAVIGPGGKVIREICDKSGAKVDITDDGVITISGMKAEATQVAVAMIKDIVVEPEVGEIYEGKVAKITDFGAFVTIMGKKDGLLHISEISEQRLRHASDVLEEGQAVKVLLLEIDKQGRIRFRMKGIEQ